MSYVGAAACAEVTATAAAAPAKLTAASRASERLNASSIRWRRRARGTPPRANMPNVLFVVVDRRTGKTPDAMGTSVLNGQCAAEQAEHADEPPQRSEERRVGKEWR